LTASTAESKLSAESPHHSFCAAIRRRRDTLGCSVYVIHYTGWHDSGRERGSIVLRAAADVVIQVGKAG
jgi:hypothetical protein